MDEVGETRHRLTTAASDDVVRLPRTADSWCRYVPSDDRLSEHVEDPEGTVAPGAPKVAIYYGGLALDWLLR